MSARRWIVLGCVALGLWCGLWCGTPQVRAEPAHARPLLTNASIGTRRVTRSPAQVVTEATPGSDLRRIDVEAERSLAALQAGKPCAQIRDASRVSWRAQLLGQHERELSVGLALLLGAGLLTVLIRSTAPRALMILPPLVGALYLGRVACQRVEATRSATSEGLRACTAELPPSDLTQPERVKLRLDRSQELVSKIRRVADATTSP